MIGREKRLSYAKDRRNDYGENDKSSRKNIRRNKRFPHRANRRREHQILHAGVEEVLYLKRPKRWRKYRDAPLGEIVQDRIERRMRMGIVPREVGDPRISRIQYVSVGRDPR
ncbi:hypothetical protein [Herbidospora sp. NBRC 101105]|uniref:hypothetical protein n=1 Tax=Herbidospora sp. NBRC 101105 TaxID=3032195 RepID=UPI0024A4B16C|nr:hypothetical protein [Herbidospora sp. NBRC 101105]GLX94684.1 hypothetical protein Hesp01_26340 [Herbidospora sp. NBRC 101105]